MSDDEDYGAFNPDNPDHKKLASQIYDFIEENPMIRTPDLKQKTYDYIYSKGEHSEKGNKEDFAIKTSEDGTVEEKWSESSVKNVYVPDALTWLEAQGMVEKVAKEDGQTGGKDTHHWEVA